MAAPTPTPAAQVAVAPVPLRRIFIVNLTLLLALGVAGSGWIIRYTDWFPAVGGVLALGGLFSWLAFVSKLLSEEVTRQLQEKFLAVFSQRYVCMILLLLAAALAITAAFFGAIRIEVQSTAQIRGFDLYREGSNDSDPQLITPEGSTNIPVPSRLAAPSVWRVKITGYPYRQVTVSPVVRQSLYIPQSFDRPVLLLVPNMASAGMAARRGVVLDLQIEAGDHRLKIPKYTWFAFWVGCGPDVQVPPAVQAQLRTMFPTGQYPYLDPSLNAPLSNPAWLDKGKGTFASEFALPAEITITGIDGHGSVRLKKKIRLGGSRTDFVQLEFFDENDWLPLE